MRVADRSHLTTALLLSALLHGALVFTVPGMRLPDFIEPPEELLEFEVRERESEQPSEPLPEPEPEPELLKQPEELAPPQESADAKEESVEEQERISEPEPDVMEALDPKLLSSALRRQLPTAPARAPKAVWLPKRAPQKLTAETIAIAPPSRSEDESVADEKIERVAATPVKRAPDMSAAREVAKKLLASLGGAPAKVKRAQAVEKPKSAPGTPEIGGEVGIKRTVVRHPPPPSVKIDNPVTVEMEFWVSPNGDVIRAHALRTGEAHLDRAAAQYVKGFKFNALDAGESGQQRGVILVRFSWR